MITHESKKIGLLAFDLMKRLFNINRSLTGEGNRKTLKIIKKKIRALRILEFKSGKKVFDWIVPPEWNVKDAYVLDQNKKKIIDFKKNNLHLVGYSKAIKKKVSLGELKKHLYTYKSQPDAIPYVTSYYNKTWGFCLPFNKLKKLKKGEYYVNVDSVFNNNGSLTIGEYKIKGKSNKEILLSTNICHPSMANNELSGPVISTFLIDYFSKRKNYYSMRFLFLPETIGPLAYLSKNLRTVKKNFLAGYHLTCIGDGGEFSMIEAKEKYSYSTKLAKMVLDNYSKKKVYSFLERGSDERQYNNPGINLPVVTLMRTKFGSYKEYHSSYDNLKFVKPKNLQDSYEYVLKILKLAQNDFKIYSTVKGEPFLSKRNLYRKFGVRKNLDKEESKLFDLISYSDGDRLSEISKKINVDPIELIETVKLLKKHKLISTHY